MEIVKVAQIVIAGVKMTALCVKILYVKYALTMCLIVFNAFHMLALDQELKSVSSVPLDAHLVCIQSIHALNASKTIS